MMVPGGKRDWVMLEIDPGTTFLNDATLTACSQAALDGPEVTYMKVVHLLWAMSTMCGIEGGEPMWPHEVAQTVTDALKDAHAQAVEEIGEDDLRERFDMTVVEVSRVLEQVEADINAQAAQELKRLRVRRDA